MKLKEIHLKKFKRFTDLTITANGEAIIRDTITPLITPDTQVYQQLERLIFG